MVNKLFSGSLML